MSIRVGLRAVSSRLAFRSSAASVTPCPAVPPISPNRATAIATSRRRVSLCPHGFLAEVCWPFFVFAGELLLANPSPISSDLLFFTFLLYFLS
jgi:hypothetical protein